MDPVRPVDPETWARIAGLAGWRLEHPGEAAPLEALRNLSLRLRVWSGRPGGPHASWGPFLLLPGDARPLVREVRWNAPGDRRRLASSFLKRKLRSGEQPDVLVRDADVDEAALGPFLRQAGRVLSAPGSAAVPSPEGDVLGIEGYGALTYVRLEWSGEIAVAHRRARAWTMRLKRLLESSLRDRESA